MPDAPAPSAPDRAEIDAGEADAGLVRSVRRRLVLWSGGTTLLVLLVLAVALYVSVASTLEAAGTAVLDDRARDIVAALRNERPGPDEAHTDFSFGGGGTFAILIAPDGTTIGPRQFQMPSGLPDGDAAAAATATGRDVRLRLVTFSGPSGAADVAVPVRQLTVPTDTSEGRFVVQVLQDRTAEARTLGSLLAVLLVGGLVVVLVAFGFGTIYARRALVPIRNSLTAQRAALRRQRDFAADASHELRTPLTVIRSSVDHLRRNAKQPVEKVGDALEDIDAEVEHLTSMVEGLLLLARSDSGAITLERLPVDLDDVASEAASAMAATAQARNVRLVVDPEPAPAVGDPARLRQLVMILVDNAIRHSPTGGEVRIIVRPAADAAGAASAMTLAVEDDGPGVRPEDAPHIFERFWRAPGAPAGGTGLGLAIARWIAEGHGGGINVTGRPEGGARFEVRIPGRPVPPASAAPSPAGSPVG
ncbi:MAG TPA: HAMP domain-containing sensor histidine kinase [Candidatus Eisenbacteria bacterium]|nr:HAMP domain-containing sensor histidine kinase [Candidatus Eisenbacteria bacterium]